MWQHVSRGSADVAPSELTTHWTCEVSSLFHEQEVPVERPSGGSVQKLNSIDLRS